MPKSDSDVGRLAANLRRGCVVAAAGCGKTEQIVIATSSSDARRLILTHTHSGVHAITTRLKKCKVPTPKYHVDTIAGWCLRASTSFPQRSGLDTSIRLSGVDWNDVYRATVRLMQSGAVSSVLHASYCGVFVDEYQDCSREQHAVIRLLADELPCCVFGDPLQGIFDFGDQDPVDWESDVYPTFPMEAELKVPWRWKNAGNEPLSDWLSQIRKGIEDGAPVDLAGCPSCVMNVPLPSRVNLRQQTITKACLAALRAAANKRREDCCACQCGS